MVVKVHLQEMYIFSKVLDLVLDVCRAAGIHYSSPLMFFRLLQCFLSCSCQKSLDMLMYWKKNPTLL